MMAGQSTSRRRRSRALSVEVLEDRLVPAVVTENYPGAPYVNGYGTPVPGIYRETAQLMAEGGQQMEVVLDPLTPLSEVSPIFKVALATNPTSIGGVIYYPWTFTYENAPINLGLNLSVKTYAAQGRTTMNFAG